MAKKKKQKKSRAAYILLGILLFSLAIAFVCHRPLLRMYFVYDHADTVRSLSEQYDVPEYLLCGVIWSESHFDPEAVSSAGACGMMQMMKPTFDEMRSRLGLTGEGNIFDPEQNLLCGTYYLHYLYDQFGDWDTVLAAYNAGLTHVIGWLYEPDYSDDGITLKDIPFPETKNYLKKVHLAEKIYDYLYNY